MKFSQFFSLLLLLSITTFFACDDDDPVVEPPAMITTEAELTDALNTTYEQKKAPGFAVTIVENSEIVYQQSFGQADMASNTPYSNSTVQPIG